MVVFSELLAPITLLDQVLGILLHHWPIIPECEGTVSECLSANVIPISALMYFLKHIVSLLWGEALE